MNIYRKKFLKKYNPIREFSQLNLHQAFYLELEAYRRLGTEPNFPSLIGYNEKDFTIDIERCGVSLKDLKKGVTLSKNDLKKQISHISRALNKARVVHLDICETGKNICFKDGCIYLIDFDLCVIDDKPLNSRVAELYHKYIAAKEDVFDRLYRVISKFTEDK
jgi:predicted Ser/Thr protein kinase